LLTIQPVGVPVRVEVQPLDVLPSNDWLVRTKQKAKPLTVPAPLRAVSFDTTRAAHDSEPWIVADVRVHDHSSLAVKPDCLDTISLYEIVEVAASEPNFASDLASGDPSFRPQAFKVTNRRAEICRGGSLVVKALFCVGNAGHPGPLSAQLSK